MNQIATTAPAAFDYSTLHADLAKEARATAIRIRSNEQNATQAILEIGNDLIAIKAKLDHGQFVAWVEAECAAAVRTAQNYMKAAQAFEGKHATVAHLAPTTVYALAAAPDNTRAAIIEKIEAGERPTEGEIRSAIYGARAIEKQAKLEAKATPRKRRDKARELAEQKKREEQFERQRLAAEEATGRLAEKIRDAFKGDLTELCALLEASDVAPRLLWELAPEKAPMFHRVRQQHQAGKSDE